MTRIRWINTDIFFCFVVVFLLEWALLVIFPQPFNKSTTNYPYSQEAYPENPFNPCHPCSVLFFINKKAAHQLTDSLTIKSLIEIIQV